MNVGTGGSSSISAAGWSAKTTKGVKTNIIKWNTVIANWRVDMVVFLV
ncbi:MAG: hypothetical protein IJH67_01870 [Thermoguttaceae bacterium]|nr:hypothetical protein [Thermoguttaceae bacterium]